MPSTSCCPGPPAGDTASHRPPAGIVVGFAKNQCTHILSVLSSGSYDGAEECGLVGLNLLTNEFGKNNIDLYR